MTGNSVRRPRILWVIQETRIELERSSDHPTQRLYHVMCQKGLDVALTTLDAIDAETLMGVDLVLFDASDNFDTVVQIAAIRVRLQSRVPLIILTQSYTSHQLVLALRSGIDAIWSYQTPPDLLLARCNAMLRRWRGSAAFRKTT